jgi:Fe-S cluster assembly protein SufD
MMDESIAFYQNQYIPFAANIPWFADMRAEALQQFVEKGFPTRFDENWKYTSVELFLKHRFQMHPTPANLQEVFVQDSPCNAYQFALVNGFLTKNSALPAGVMVMSLLDAIAAIPEKVKPYLGHILKSGHAFHALNTSMLAQGLVIYVAPHIELSEPLWLSHWQSQVGVGVHLRHLIIVDEGASVSVVEDYSGDAALCYYTNTVTEVHLAQAAHLTHYKIQREGQHAFHVGHIAVAQDLKSQFASHMFSLGGQWVRSDIAIQFQQPEARCSMNGLYVPTDVQHMDHHTLVEHSVENCQSEQDYKGIIKGHARAVFNGRVLVEKGANRTVAKQQNKNLLLSPHAEIDTKPQLEIYSDDIICTHGATVGELDEEALYYLATRGISHEDACRFLMQAFVTENIGAIPNEKLAAWISELFFEQIG